MLISFKFYQLDSDSYRLLFANTHQLHDTLTLSVGDGVIHWSE